MLRMCAEKHRPVVYDGEKYECPVCILLEEQEELQEVIKQSAEVIGDLKKKIKEKIHTEGACTENIELDI